MQERILVMMTMSTEEEAERIARALLEERLVACANLVRGLRSFYHWKGEICDDREVLVFCKTRRELFGALAERVKSLHSYEVPEIIALPLCEGWGPYLDWLDTETAGGSG